jgi:hypothetical protein
MNRSVPFCLVALAGCRSFSPAGEQAEPNAVDEADPGADDIGGDAPDIGADTAGGDCTGATGDVRLEGTLSGSLDVCASATVTLDGAFIVPAGGVLTLEPGTIVWADALASLTVERGGQIRAVGTPDAPITFTSAAATPAAGDWTGLVLYGGAPGQEVADGDPTDNSGALSYLRVAWAGAPTATGSRDALSAHSVGAGTVLDHIDVLASAGDAFDMHGGTVNLSYAVAEGMHDDGLDWTDGWVGTAQYVYLASSQDDRGVEGANRDPLHHPVDTLPQSSPNLYNFTIVGAGGNGIALEHGTSARLVNSVVLGAGGCGLSIDAESATYAADSLSFRNDLFYFNVGGAYCPLLTPGVDGDAAQFAVATLTRDPQLSGRLPLPSSPALDPANADTSVSSFLGAFGVEDWTTGWVLAD